MYNEEEKEKEYPKLTPEQEKKVNWSIVWRYVYPGFVLLSVFLLPYDTPLVAGIGMIPYAFVTFLLSLKPSLVFVFAMQKSKKVTLHVPENEEEAARYRADGKALSILLLVLTVVFFVIWFVRKSKG